MNASDKETIKVNYQKAKEYLVENNYQILKRELRENGLHILAKEEETGKNLSFRVTLEFLFQFVHTSVKKEPWIWKKVLIMNKEEIVNNLGR